MGDAIHVDLSALRGLTAALRKVDAETATNVRKTLREGGTLVRTKARERIAPHSSRIGGSISVTTAGAAVRISAGGARAPHAAPFEHDGVPGTFRHPVYGNRENWVSQDAHPFLTPAFVESQDDIIRASLKALDVMFAAAGFR